MLVKIFIVKKNLPPERLQVEECLPLQFNSIELTFLFIMLCCDTVYFWTRSCFDGFEDVRLSEVLLKRNHVEVGVDLLCIGLNMNYCDQL